MTIVADIGSGPGSPLERVSFGTRKSTITSLTTKTALFSILSSSRTAQRGFRSPTRKRPRRSSRRCRSVRSMRARTPPRLPSHPLEAKDLHRSPMVKALGGLSLVVCCIVRAMPRVPPCTQLLCRQHLLDHLPSWLRAHRQPREICHSISMTQNKRDSWTSSYRWALPKIRLLKIPTSSSPGLLKNRPQLASLLQLMNRTSPGRLHHHLLACQLQR